MHTVVFVQGGGIGKDQELSVRRLFEAVGVPVAFEVYTAGRAALDQGRDALPDDVFAAIRARGVALKTKLLQPKGAGLPTPHGPSVPTNFNVAFRRRLGLFASVRPVHNLAGLASRFTGVNFLLVREITEDLYTASEHELVPGVVQSFKIVTEATSLRFFRFAFELARKTGRKTVHCIHKANILKMADGLFLDCFRRVATEFPDITARDLIVDNTCMQLVSRPQQFDVMAAGNLYGDLLSDLGAGLVGGVSATAAVEASPVIYVADRAMLATLFETDLAEVCITSNYEVREGEAPAEAFRLPAVEGVLTGTPVRTADIGGTATTTQFTDAVVARLKG